MQWKNFTSHFCKQQSTKRKKCFFLEKNSMIIFVVFFCFSVACEPGSWSESGVQPCMACSTCVDGFYISGCTSTADAVCNPNDCADLVTETGSKWHDPLGESYDCSWYPIQFDTKKKKFLLSFFAYRT